MMGPGPADLNAATTDKECDPSGAPLVGQRTMGPGPGLVARVVWLYCMRLASSGVGGVRRVRLAFFGRHPMHPPPPDDASRIQNIHKTPTQLPTYNNASRTRRTPPTPDDASRMQYSHTTRATSPVPGPIVFEHLVFSLGARPGRGLAASSSTSNRVNSTWFKYLRKK